MPPKKAVPTKPASKKPTPTKPGITKAPVGRGSVTTGGGRTASTKQAATGAGKKAVPVKTKTSTDNSKGGVKSSTEGTPKKRVWTEKDTMARKIQNAYRVYRCVLCVMIIYD